MLIIIIFPKNACACLKKLFHFVFVKCFMARFFLNCYFRANHLKQLIFFLANMIYLSQNISQRIRNPVFFCFILFFELLFNPVGVVADPGIDCWHIWQSAILSVRNDTELIEWEPAIALYWQHHWAT
jgi:hypothetical protein